MSKKHVIRRLLAFTGPYRRFLWLALLCAALSVAMSLVSPVLVGNAIDAILGPGQVDFAAIGRILALLIGSILLGALFQWLMSMCTNLVSYRTIRDLRAGVFDKLLHVPLRYIDSQAHGNLMNRIVNDIDLISDGLLQGFTQLFTGVVTILGTLGFMLSINSWIALVVVALTPVSLVIASVIAKGTHQTFYKQTKVQGELSGYVEEMIGGQKTVKTFGYEAESEKGFEEINKRLYHWGLRAQIYPAFTNPLTRFVNGLVYAAVGVAGALAAIQGRLSVGQLSCFLSYANQYTKPFNEVTGIIAQLQTAISSATRVFEVLDEPDEPHDAVPAQAIAKCQGHVAACHVSFAYDPARPLIEDFNLRVKPGQRVAIVGPTGCGKTTLINLLMRFYDVDRGHILVDGVDIAQMPRRNLRGLYGMVLQETWLTHATVRDNIAYGKPDASMEEVKAAAKAAHAHGFITRLEKGYDTVISENGGNLSQGQKQLLCIARVMLMNPPMLILDEATSSIDTRTEIRVQKAFEKMMEGRTSFIVAHRLSTIKEADVILVMNQGHVIEQGTHEELLRRTEFYFRLYESQFAKAEA